MFPARRLGTLVVGLLAATALTTAPADAGPAVPVNCSGGPVEIRTDDLTYDLNGTCGVVRVLADDVVVRMPTATRVVVRGHRNTVVTKSVGTLGVQGRHHEVRTVSVQHLRVASPDTAVEIEGLVETARLGGRGARVTADRVSTLRVPGARNTLRTGHGFDASIGGNANTVRFRRLESLVVTGNDNAAGVRRGETSVRNDGRGNRISVARRS